MILMSLIRKILNVRRKFKGVDLEFQDFYLLRAYHPTKDNDCFSGKNRFGLPDVLFSVSGVGQNSTII